MEQEVQGPRLVLIGVHTPEFEFETDVDNVRRAAESMNIEYPIAMDNSYAVWRVQQRVLASNVLRRCEG